MSELDLNRPNRPDLSSIPLEVVRYIESLEYGIDKVDSMCLKHATRCDELSEERDKLKDNSLKALSIMEEMVSNADENEYHEHAEAIREVIERLHDENLMGNAYYCECDNCGNCYQVVIPETTCENCGKGIMQPQDVDSWE